MYSEIISAIINFFAGIIPTFVSAKPADSKKKLKKSTTTLNNSTGVRFLQAEDNFNYELHHANSIYMYTVNSHELYGSLNLMLEHDPSLTLSTLTIMVRKKPDECEKDLQDLNTIISQWRNWVNRGRIKQLDIISYDHDPDHYYTIIGEQIVFCGQVLYDEGKPTGTTVQYKPLVFSSDTELGKTVIRNYHLHFQNVLEKYKRTNLLYSSYN